MKMNLLLSIIVASQMAWTITATSCTSHIRLLPEKGRELEILTNKNGTVPFPLLTKYSAQPENVIGLKYMNPKTKRERIVNCDKDFCYPPYEPCLWPDYSYMLAMSASWSAPMECLSVKIAKEEGGEEFDITPPHPNGTVDLQQIAIALHVPEVDGLKYRVHGTDPWKNVPCIDKLCHPPRPTEPRERRYGERETDCTWGTQTYIMMEKQKKNIEDYDLEDLVKILEGVAKSSSYFGEGIMNKIKALGEKTGLVSKIWQGVWKKLFG